MKNSDHAVWKWSATACLIVGTMINSLGIYPGGALLLILGALLWLVVATLWKDMALITTNAIMALVGIVGVLYTTVFQHMM